MRALLSALIAILAIALGCIANADEQDSPWSTGWGVFRVAKTSGFTPTLADRGTVFDCTSGTFTVNLPSAASVGSGYHVAVYDSGSGTITVSVGSGMIRTPSGAAATTTLTQGQGALFECDGTNYSTVASAGLATTPGGAAGGDLSGTYPNPTVAKVNGTALGTTLTTAGTILGGSGSAIASLTMSGDATINGSGVVTLKNTGPGAGSFTSANITIDAQGRVTAASNGSSSGSSLLFVATATKSDGNTTTATSLVGTGTGSMTLAANYWSAGKTVRLRGYGLISTTGTPTLDINCKLGSFGASLGAVTLPTLSNAGIDFEYVITCVTTGASGSYNASGFWRAGTAFGVEYAPTTTFDTTTSKLVDVIGTWGTASASNTLTIINLTLEALN